MLAADQDNEKIIEWIHTCHDRCKMSYRDIARDLDKKGFMLQSGKSFSRMAVTRLYKGVIVDFFLTKGLDVIKNKSSLAYFRNAASVSPSIPVWAISFLTKG